MVVVMGTTKATGPLFTRDKHRLSVMFSRQKSGLVVFGDLDAMRLRDMDLEVLNGMCSFFKSHGRVIEE